MAALTLSDITKRFKADTVLDGVSLDVGEGETLVLFGPSGAGKTVLLRLIAGVIEPDEGRILIHGRDVGEVAPEERGVGMAFQNFALFPHMSALQNIASPLEAKKASKTAIGEAVQSIARLLKIDHVLDHAPRALSNGQKQRTALARALVGSPSILLLDDPLRNVDAKLRYEMRLELPRLLAAQQASVIYVTQDYKEAMALGDRIAVMAEGEFRQIGTPESIYLSPLSIEIARLFGDPTINLLEVTPETDAQGPFARLSGSRVPLESGLAHSAGRHCVLGVRPESLRFAEASEDGAVPVVIEAETPLNEKIVTLALTKAGREILMSRPAGTRGPGSSEAFIAADSKDILLFDKESGLRIEAADASVSVTA